VCFWLPIVFLMFQVRSSLANPLMPLTMNPLSVWFYGAVAVILGGESYVVVWLLRSQVRSRFVMWRWLFLMNTLTWMLAFGFLMLDFGGPGALVLIEIAIISVEAKVITAIVNRPWISSGSPAPVTFRKGMRASIIGNVASWFLGFVMMMVPVF